MSGFCAPMDKKLMMKRSEKLTERVFSLISRVFKNAVMGAVLGMTAIGPAVAAETNTAPKLPPFVQFSYHQNDFATPSYSVAMRAMRPMYLKAQPNDPPGEPMNPLIGIAEENLGGDQIPEIIATPTEAMEERDLFCSKNGLCPFYILQPRGKQLHTLGVIWANRISLAEGSNGYLGIIAYTQLRTGGYGFEKYVYNAKTDKYERQGPEVKPLSPAKPPIPTEQ